MKHFSVGLLVAVLSLAGGAPGHAQQSRGTVGVNAIRVNAIRPLGFGRLLSAAEVAGQSRSANAAEFEIIGPPGASVVVDLDLPTELRGEHGERLPVVFSPTSGAWSPSQSDLDGILFDPRAPTTLTLPPSGRVSVWLEGSATPRQMPSGSYTGQITLLARVQ